MQALRHLVSALVSGIGLVVSAAALADSAPVPAGTLTVTPATPSASRIWECTTKGVRTFSNNPCGTNPTVRELNPINVMEPAPAYHGANAYSPSAQTTAGYGLYSGQDASDANYGDPANSEYPGYIVINRARHTRANNVPRNHPHRHHR